MTIEEYLNLPPEGIEKLTDKELEEHFKDVLKFTRPELAAVNKAPKQLRSMTGSVKSQRTLDILGQLKDYGVDIDEL